MKTLSLAILLGGILLSGCATQSISPSQAVPVDQDRAAWVDATGDTYQIRVTRDTGQMGSLCLARISIDGKQAADLKMGESATFKVSPGTHLVKGSPALDSYLCKKFYSAPNMQAQVSTEGVAGDARAYRYSFTASGTPELIATQ